MIQETSKTAYQDIQSTAVLQRKIVRDVYRKFGPSTDKEVWWYTGIPANTVSARRNEIKDVVEIEKRKCKITRRTVISWGLSNPTQLQFF